MVVVREFRMSPAWVIWAPALVASTSVPALAAVYLTVEEAQQLIFPDRNFTLVPVTLSEDQRKTVQEKSGIPVRARQERVWRTDEGGHLIIDDVIGKHEFITFAVGINPDGSVRQVEILNYREAYGFEVRQKKWRRQFIGKTGASELSLNDDIKNISGATLSCRHVTEGVKRALALYDLIIKK